MNFAVVLLSCFGVLLIAGIYEALQARWEEYRKQAMLRETESLGLRLNEPQHQQS